VDLEDTGILKFKIIEKYRFPNPVTGMHTQNLEKLWDRENRTRRKTEASCINLRMAELIWRRHSTRKRS
jgi:hypothetical protein